MKGTATIVQSINSFTSSSGGSNIRYVKAERYSYADVVSPMQLTPAGIDSSPVKGVYGVYMRTESTGANVMAGYVYSNPIAADGEVRLFSQNDSGVDQFVIWVKKDNTCEIGGSDDNMVRYSKLEQAFNQLKSDFNTLVGKWNSFCSAYVPGSPTVTGLPATLASSTVSTSAADITLSKIENIKTSAA